MDWVALLAAVLGAGGVAGFGGSLLGGLLQRPKTRAEATKLLTDAAQQLVNEMQEETTRMRAEASESRREAAEARREASDARAEVRKLTQEASEARGQFDELLVYMRRVIAWIHKPGQTLEHLRETVPRDLPAWPERNGHSR